MILRSPRSMPTYAGFVVTLSEFLLRSRDRPAVSFVIGHWRRILYDTSARPRSQQ